MRVYNYPAPKFTSLSDEEVLTIFASLEKRQRSGSFSYSNNIHFFPQQVNEIKETWPKETIAKLREKSTQHPKESSTDVVRKIIFETLLETLVPKRAIVNNKISMVAAEKSIATDLSLSCLFKHAPVVTDMHGPRRFDANGPSFMTKTVERTGRVVIFEENYNQADIWVYAIYNHSIKRSILIGWETKEGIRGKKKGNSITNPEECPWQRAAYYFWYSELRPMSDLISKFGLKEIPSLTVLETIPKEEDIPQEPIGNINVVSENKSQAGDEEAFFKSLMKANPTSVALKKGPSDSL